MGKVFEVMVMTGITNNIDKIAAALILVVFAGGCIAWRRQRKKRLARARAAAAFRSRVLTAVEGLYPVTKYWRREVFDRFRETVPEIESAAAEFRHFIPLKSRASFDTALKNYREHCNNITWESCAGFNICPEKKFTEEIGPKEIFRQNVNALLDFAKRYGRP